MEQSGTICCRGVLAAVVSLTILPVPEIAAAGQPVKLNVLLRVWSRGAVHDVTAERGTKDEREK